MGILNTATGDNHSLGSLLIVGNGNNSSKTRSNAFRVTYDSKVYTGAGGAYNSSGADYGKYIERR